MPYRPVSSNDRFVTSTVKAQRSRLSSLEALTGGQVNSQLYALSQRAEIVSDRLEASGWRLTNNQWTTVVEGTIEVPPGRSSAHVLAAGSGSVWYSRATGADAEVVVDGLTRKISVTAPFLSGNAALIGLVTRNLNVEGKAVIDVSMRVRFQFDNPALAGTNTAFLDLFTAFAS